MSNVPGTAAARAEFASWPDWHPHYVVDERTGQTGGA